MQHDVDTKAKTLVHAQLMTDQEAADKFGVNRTTIWRWREGLDDDPKLQRKMAQEWAKVRSADSWIQDATHTIRSAQSFIRNAADDLDTSDPRAVEAMTQALQTITDALQMARIVDARLGTSRQNGEEGRQNVARQLAGSET